jgi:hypothetical protein
MILKKTLRSARLSRRKGDVQKRNVVIGVCMSSFGENNLAPNASVVFTVYVTLKVGNVYCCWRANDVLEN